MRLFTIIVGLSALFIAGSAAFFSVTGLSLLFSGSRIPVIIMASSLEIGKLVAATYLHRYWSDTRKIFRVYMLGGVLTLVFITSAGIFGFLSNAYKQVSITNSMVERQIDVLDRRKTNLSADFSRWETRIQTLSDQRTQQEIQYKSLTDSAHWVNAKRVYTLITESTDEIKELNDQINANRDSIASIDNQILNVQADNIDIEREIGGFRFIADSFEGEIDDVVKWFIYLLIFVFDPMAVSLVLAFNTVLLKDLNEKKKKRNLTEKSPPEKNDPRLEIEDVVDEIDSDNDFEEDKYWSSYLEEPIPDVFEDEKFDEDDVKDINIDVDDVSANLNKVVEDAQRKALEESTVQKSQVFTKRDQPDLVNETIPEYIDETTKNEPMSAIDRAKELYGEKYWTHRKFDWNKKHLWESNPDAKKYWLRQRT